MLHVLTLRLLERATSGGTSFVVPCNEQGVGRGSGVGGGSMHGCDCGITHHHHEPLNAVRRRAPTTMTTS